MTQKTARRLTLILVVGLLAYFIVIGYRGFYLLGRHQWDLKLLGAVVLAFPSRSGCWVVVAEIRFGFTTQLLAEELERRGRSTRPSRRCCPDCRPAVLTGLLRDCPVRQSAVVEVEADPKNWRGWYYLAVAYDLAGDRRRARAAMRTAAEVRYSNKV